MACKHKWKYAGGTAKCTNCGKYMQPNGKVTKTPTGRRKGDKSEGA